MGSFDQLILDSLKDGSKRSFKEILAKAGISHNTLRRYPQRLMTEGLVSRTENVRNRRGRPEYSYYLTPKASARALLHILKSTLNIPVTDTSGWIAQFIGSYPENRVVLKGRTVRSFT